MIGFGGVKKLKNRLGHLSGCVKDGWAVVDEVIRGNRCGEWDSHWIRPVLTGEGLRIIN